MALGWRYSLVAGLLPRIDKAPNSILVPSIKEDDVHKYCHDLITPETWN